MLCVGFTQGSSFNLCEQAGPQRCYELGRNFCTVEFDVHQRSSLAHTNMLCSHGRRVGSHSFNTTSASCAALLVRSVIRSRYEFGSRIIVDAALLLSETLIRLSANEHFTVHTACLKNMEMAMNLTAERKCLEINHVRGKPG